MATLKPISIQRALELLNAINQPKSNDYMIVRTNNGLEKRPYNATACGVFIGKKGTGRKYVSPDVDVVAYRVHV